MTTMTEIMTILDLKIRLKYYHFKKIFSKVQIVKLRVGAYINRLSVHPRKKINFWKNLFLRNEEEYLNGWCQTMYGKSNQIIILDWKKKVACFQNRSLPHIPRAYVLALVVLVDIMESNKSNIWMVYIH